MVFGPGNELGKVALLLAGAGGHAGGGQDALKVLELVLHKVVGGCVGRADGLADEADSLAACCGRDGDLVAADAGLAELLTTNVAGFLKKEIFRILIPFKIFKTNRFSKQKYRFL